MVWKPRVVVASVIEEQGRFLMVEEQVNGQRVLNQPAGHLEYGESLIEAVRRETREETGLVFEPEALLGVMQLDNPDPDRVYLRFVFSGSHQHPARPPTLDPDILALHWLRPGEIRRHPQLTPRSALVLASIRLYQDGVRHPLELLHRVS
ncbi:MAG TPA: NUDIX hydrolase [Thiolinea sp.]|nr:NUDIX hydrolase [Thiolinea sp.]